MKKCIMLFACVVFAGITASAQQVYEVTKVEKVSKTVGRVYAGDKFLDMNIYFFKEVKQAPSSFYFVEAIGEKGYIQTVAKKENVHYAVLAVDSVGLSNDDKFAVVYLSDKSVYGSSNMEWLKVQPGQHVEKWVIQGKTKNISHVRTVDRATTLLTTRVPVSASNRKVAQVTNLSANGNNVQMTTPPAPPAKNNTATRPPLIRK